MRRMAMEKRFDVVALGELLIDFTQNGTISNAISNSFVSITLSSSYKTFLPAYFSTFHNTKRDLHFLILTDYLYSREK